MIFHHHHYVPSVVNRSAVMDLHRSRSCATLIQSLYDIFVHSLMLSVHIVLGLPRPLLPFILPSISNRCTPSPLIICPKYWHFLFLIVFSIDLYLLLLLTPIWWNCDTKRVTAQVQADSMQETSNSSTFWPLWKTLGVAIPIKTFDVNQSLITFPLLLSRVMRSHNSLDTVPL